MDGESGGDVTREVPEGWSETLGHATIDNKELERRYNTLETLAAHPEIRKFVGWIGNKPHGGAAGAGDILTAVRVHQPHTGERSLVSSRFREKGSQPWQTCTSTSTDRRGKRVRT
jgi:hypothetical protein